MRVAAKPGNPKGLDVLFPAAALVQSHRRGRASTGSPCHDATSGSTVVAPSGELLNRQLLCFER